MARKPGLGLLLPVRRGAGGYFEQGYTAKDQVKSNIVNLLLTKKNERVMQPEFGCGLHEYIFEAITDDMIANVRGTIEEAIQLWLPFITVEEVDITKNEDRNEIFITVTYRIKSNVRITDSVTLVI